MIVSRFSWFSGAAAAGIGVMTLALVVGLLDQILPTLPRLSVSLAWIPGLLVGIGATYGAWSTLKLALQSHSWADFRALLLKTWIPFDPAEHGGKPRQPVEGLRPEQIAQEIRQTQLRHQKTLNRIKQQVQAEIQTCERAQAQLHSKQQRCQALQTQAQQLQQYLQYLETFPTRTSPQSQKSNQERALRRKLRQLQSQVITLKTELERQRLQLQHSETERAQLQQQQQKLKRLLQRTQRENQELHSQQEQWAKQMEQTQQKLQTLQTSYRALKVLQEVEECLSQSNSA